MSKRPAFQFYPSDWRNEPGLRLCSLAARGLWMEMMCLMHEGAPYGHLTVKGRPMRTDELARLIGESAAQVKRWQAELNDNEVYSVTDDGVIFSRRMVRDEALREVRAAGGQKGVEHGGKGAEHGAKGGRPRKSKPPLDEVGRGVIKPSPSSPSPSADNSEAIASGGDRPPDPDKVMFDSGRRLLMAAGKSSDQAGKLLGQWRAMHGTEAVITALGRAQREGAIDPVSFIIASLGAQNGKRHRSDRPSAWAPAPGFAGLEPASLDD